MANRKLDLLITSQCPLCLVVGVMPAASVPIASVLRKDESVWIASPGDWESI